MNVNFWSDVVLELSEEQLNEYDEFRWGRYRDGANLMSRTEAVRRAVFSDLPGWRLICDFEDVNGGDAATVAGALKEDGVGVDSRRTLLRALDFDASRELLEAGIELREIKDANGGDGL